MLNVQPIKFQNSRKFSFSSEIDDDSKIQQDNEMKSEYQNHVNQLHSIENDKNSPGFLKKVAKIGSVICIALVGGATTKYGLDYTISFAKKMASKKGIKPLFSALDKLSTHLKSAIKKFGAKIKNNEKYQNASNKFKSSYLGKNIIKGLGKLKETNIYKEISKSVKNIRAKLEEVTISICAGVSAICSGAEAAGFVKPKTNNEPKKTEKHHFRTVSD